MKPDDLLTIGELAGRTGLSVSAIRFYEDKGLVRPLRTGGNQRRFLRADIRRLSFVLIAQRLGLSLADIAEAMADLPHGRTPNARDWARISGAIRTRIDAQIARLEKCARTSTAASAAAASAWHDARSTTRTTNGAAAERGPACSDKARAPIGRVLR